MVSAGRRWRRSVTWRTWPFWREHVTRSALSGVLQEFWFRIPSVFRLFDSIGIPLIPSVFRLFKKFIAIFSKVGRMHKSGKMFLVCSSYEFSMETDRREMIQMTSKYKRQRIHVSEDSIPRASWKLLLKLVLVTLGLKLRSVNLNICRSFFLWNDLINWVESPSVRLSTFLKNFYHSLLMGYLRRSTCVLRVDTLRAQKRGPITAGENFETTYSKPRISRIRVDRKIHPTYAKIRLMRSEMKGFGTIVPEILSEICKDPTYARLTVLIFDLFRVKWPKIKKSDIIQSCRLISPIIR